MTTPTPLQQLALYRTMLRIRRFEETAARLLAEARLPGFLHLSIGQEATAAGTCAALRPEDYIATNHRGHGHCIAKGGDPGRMLAELFGRSDGYCKGRAGSMHIADPDAGILGANGIVAGGLGMAIGAAFAQQVQGTGRIALAFFGEGAVAEGLFHECLNLAALWTLPVLFFCENNLYAEMTGVQFHLHQTQVTRHAEGHGVPGVTVDGNDVVAVYEAVAAAAERARSGGGPTLIEAHTYRWHGHFEGDPQKYREPAEAAAWRERDPLRRCAAVLTAAGLADELAATAAAVEAELQAALEFAESSPRPGPEALLQDVYAGGTP